MRQKHILFREDLCIAVYIPYVCPIVKHHLAIEYRVGAVLQAVIKEVTVTKRARSSKRQSRCKKSRLYEIV